MESLNIIFKNKISTRNFQSLHKDAGWKILDNKTIKKSIKNSTFVVSVEIDNICIGMARLVSDDASHGLLCDVIVKTQYQGLGIGKQLVQKVLAYCQGIADKNDQFLLELLPTANNVDFYLKCGFKHDLSQMEGCYLWLKKNKIF